jgi:hypothetical protein
VARAEDPADLHLTRIRHDQSDEDDDHGDEQTGRAVHTRSLDMTADTIDPAFVGGPGRRRIRNSGLGFPGVHGGRLGHGA